MTTAAPVMTRTGQGAAGAFLTTGVVMASMTDAIASTALSLGRADVIGDTHATPDEFAWLEVGYTASKLAGFLIAPWLMSRIEPRTLVILLSLIVGAACCLSATTARLDLLTVLRVLQGFAGGATLVSGQAILFLTFPRGYQPVLQALFAIGAVVAPATITPALQGWLIDARSWTWIFSSVVPIAMAAIGFLLLADDPALAPPARGPFDWLGALLICAALTCFTYVLSQGSRWNWFEEPRILWTSLAGAALLLAFLIQQLRLRGRGLVDVTLFRSDDFSFALVVSFVAGAALFGSAFLIPAFAVSVLAFTPTGAGQLLLPSSLLFIGALGLAAFLIQVRRLPPIAMAPFGILLIMVAMWMLSDSTRDSGAGDMMPAILLRGLGLGFLFLAITLVAFMKLDSRSLGAGIGFFNAGRVLGGLMGVAALQTLISHNTAANSGVLSGHILPGAPFLDERLAATTAMLSQKGVDAAAAGQSAALLLGRAVNSQSAVIAFETAFLAVTLLFVVAAPFVITIKIALARRARLCSSRPDPSNSA